MSRKRVDTVLAVYIYNVNISVRLHFTDAMQLIKGFTTLVN